LNPREKHNQRLEREREREGYNEELRNLHTEQTVAKIIELRKVDWAGYIAQ
jgi:hypothetical protein